MAGRPSRKPTVQQIHDAYTYAKTGAGELDIVAAVGIPEATFRNNRDKKHWALFRAEIKRGRGEGNVIVAGENYQAAKSKTDTTRAAARALHLKLTGAITDKVEVAGDPDKPLMTKDMTRRTGLTPSEAQAILGQLQKARSKE